MRAKISGWLSSEILMASSIVRTLPLVSSGVGKARIPEGAVRYSRGSCCSVVVGVCGGRAPVSGAGASGFGGAVIVMDGAWDGAWDGTCPGTAGGAVGVPGAGGNSGLAGKGGVPDTGGVPPGRGVVCC
jgi:hypothetical protein